MGNQKGNRGLERASRNVAQTFRFAYMWYKINVTATISGSQTDKFPVVGQSLETSPTGESRSYKQLLRGIVVWRPLLQGSSQLQAAPAGNRGLETTPTGKVAATSSS